MKTAPPRSPRFALAAAVALCLLTGAAPASALTGEAEAPSRAQDSAYESAAAEAAEAAASVSQPSPNGTGYPWTPAPSETPGGEESQGPTSDPSDTPSEGPSSSPEPPPSPEPTGGPTDPDPTREPAPQPTQAPEPTRGPGVPEDREDRDEPTGGKVQDPATGNGSSSRGSDQGTPWSPSEDTGSDYSDPVPHAPGDEEDESITAESDPDGRDAQADGDETTATDDDATADSADSGLSWPIALIIALGLAALGVVAFLLARGRSAAAEAD